jgi:hypothetical protein
VNLDKKFEKDEVVNKNIQILKIKQNSIKINTNKTEKENVNHLNI